MAADRRPNKNSATEDELGKIHNLVTKIHNLRLEEMLKLISQGANVEDVVGDGKALAAAGKWVSEQNSVTSAPAEIVENTELYQRLKQIKQEQKLKGAIPFIDEESTH